MSWLGMGRGIMKIIEGVAEGDGEKVMRGVGGTALSAVGEVVTWVHSQEVGQPISEQGEAMTED
jgi:hypothetical protein